VGFFRRRQETLNEQLLREAGLDPAEALGAPSPPQPEPARSVLRVLGVPDGSSVSPREWDAAVAVEVPGLAGDRIEFTTLPHGDLIVSEETGDADVSPLADAVERRLGPPYRAVATRQDGDLWAIGAKRIEVAEIPFSGGDKLALSQHGRDRELSVDGQASDAAVPPGLEQLGEAAGGSFYAEAERIDGDLWEVRVTAL
jgi:hypothetical protein